MATYSVPPPPFVETGKFLSAYFTNQLSDCVNNRAGFVYGANVGRWTYPHEVSVQKAEGIWMLQHKYDLLRIDFLFSDDDMLIKVWLSKSDQIGGETQVHSQTYTSSGPVFWSLDLSTSPSGFSVEEGEMYFVRVQSGKVTPASGLTYVDKVYEIEEDVLTKPTISTLSSGTTVTATYLNQLVTASRDLYQKIQPYNLPFMGVRSTTSLNATNTFMRWKIKHISRYLHCRIITAPSGGGADGVELYLNGSVIGQWANDGSTQTEIFDLQALPFSVAEPTFGVEYELKVTVDRDAGGATVVYLWELPYL
jgi:hypothetical protein